jgi:CRP-like cAMP-binding protein
MATAFLRPARVSWIGIPIVRQAPGTLMDHAPVLEGIALPPRNNRHPGLTQRVLKGRKIAPLTPSERARLEGAISEVRLVPARRLLVRKGEPLEHSTLLLKGLLCRYVDDRRGHRQFVSLHIPGDLVDLHSYPMKQLDHDVGALTEAEVAIFPHAAIKAITEQDAELARKLWFATLLDAAAHREWIFRLGRLDAAGRVCHFLSETGARLQAVGDGQADRFALALTHADLGEACAVTSVHVSRVLKSLRDEGVCVFKDGRVVIHDYAALVERGQFDPSYLYLEEPPAVALNAAPASADVGGNRPNAG